MIGRLLRPDTTPRLCMQPSSTGSQLGLAPLVRHTNIRATRADGAGPLGGAMGNAEKNRLNELYFAYLRAGQVCLEARGYQVSR